MGIEKERRWASDKKRTIGRVWVKKKPQKNKKKLKVGWAVSLGWRSDVLKSGRSGVS